MDRKHDQAYSASMQKKHSTTAKLDELLTNHYDEIVAIGRRAMSSERNGHTFGATGSGLANEIVVRLLNSSDASNYNELISHATNASRRVLVDYARRRSALKRPDGSMEKMPNEIANRDSPERATIHAIDELLQHLALTRPRSERVLHYEYFGGLTHEEIADVLDTSSSTVGRESKAGKDWLRTRLNQ